MYVYVNVKGRIIEAVPVKDDYAKPDYRAWWNDKRHYAYFEKQVNAEMKKTIDGYYVREIAEKEGELLKPSNTVWYNEPNMEGAKKLFLEDAKKELEKVRKKMDVLLDTIERIERS